MIIALKKRQKFLATRTAAFLIAFFVSLIVMGVSVGGVLVLSKNPEPKRENEIISSPYIARRDEEMVVLAIGCAERGGDATAFMLFKINPIERKISVCSIPPESEATVNIKTDTLTGHYNYGGYQTVMDAVENIYDIKINSYIRVNMEGFCFLVDFFGGIEYDVPYPIETEVDMKLRKGKQMLDGKRVYTIYSGQNSSLERLRLQTDVTAELIEQNFTRSFSGSIDKIFSLLCDKSDTSISAFDLQYRKEAINHIATSEKKKVSKIYLYGKYTDRKFTPDDETITDVQSEFQLGGLDDELP